MADRTLRSPWGLGGAVYSLIRLLVRSRSFINVREVVNAFFWGSGVLLNAVHPY